MIVVSDIGEEGSPKIDPPNTAPATSGILIPMLMAMGRQMTDMMAIVPMEVPVAKERIIQRRKLSAGRSAGLRTPIKTEVR